MYGLTDNQLLGVGLCLLGSVAFMLGIAMFLDSVLMSIGNLMFLGGIPMILGIAKTKNLFLRPSSRKGSITFAVGIFLVLFRWPFFGFVLQAFGFLNLFGDFFPGLLRFARALPVIGNILNMPFIASIVDAIAYAGRPGV